MTYFVFSLKRTYKKLNVLYNLQQRFSTPIGEALQERLRKLFASTCLVLFFFQLVYTAQLQQSFNLLLITAVSE